MTISFFFCHFINGEGKRDSNQGLENTTKGTKPKTPDGLKSPYKTYTAYNIRWPKSPTLIIKHKNKPNHQGGLGPAEVTNFCGRCL